MRTLLMLYGFVWLLSACSTSVVSHADLQNQVLVTERAFAKSMADRDLKSFSSFLSDEAVFFSDDEANTGRLAIVAEWTPYFKGSTAPFSWAPDHVEVLQSGQLALSTGPVLDAKGNLIARFNSIWRREPSGEWRIIFDKGCDVCVKCQTIK